MTERPQDRIAAARRLAGRQTQAELAARLTEVTGTRWTRDMVANLEAGRRSFDVETLVAIAEIHDRDCAWYLDGVEIDRAKGLYRELLSGKLRSPLPDLTAA